MVRPTYVLCVLALSACGRFGYDALQGDAGDLVDASVDAVTADGSDASPTCTVEGPEGDATCTDGIDNDCDRLTDELDPSCGSMGCMVVTTASDESDGAESATPPHLGAGLSLREAIIIANAVDGADCIVFDGAMTIGIATALPEILGAGGLRISGAQLVVIEALAAVDTGLALNSDNNVLTGILLRGFTGVIAAGIDSRLNDNTIGPGVEVEGCGTGVKVIGERTRVMGNRLHDNEKSGLQVFVGAVDTEVSFNLLHDNLEAGTQARGAINVSFLHNSVFGNEIGFDAKESSTGLVLENNLFVGNTGFGVDAVDSTIGTLDFNGYFNTGTNCLGCTIGANSITSDPAFANTGAGDFTLSTGSPAIDKGTDTGLDTNGAAAGLFNGAAPDLGALESP